MIQDYTIAAIKGQVRVKNVDSVEIGSKFISFYNVNGDLICAVCTDEVALVYGGGGSEIEQL